MPNSVYNVFGKKISSKSTAKLHLLHTLKHHCHICIAAFCWTLYFTSFTTERCSSFIHYYFITAKISHHPTVRVWTNSHAGVCCQFGNNGLALTIYNFMLVSFLEFGSSDGKDTWISIWKLFMFMSMWWDYVSELRPITSSPQMLYEYEEPTSNDFDSAKPTNREQIVPVPLCPLQILYGLTWLRTRASAVRGRWITAWGMIWPWYMDTCVFIFA
jgi:hypothetical protein